MDKETRPHVAVCIQTECCRMVRMPVHISTREFVPATYLPQTGGNVPFCRS